MAPQHVLLLRGINVGGKNRLPMVRLAALVEQLGGTDVRTYIQSGNVAFEAGAARARALPAALSAALERDLGLSVPVVLRSASALRRALATHPFAADHDEKALHVMFLADRPPVARVKKLDAERSPGDRFVVVGREIFLCCPRGVARTRLTNAYFDAALGTVSTARNWRTAQKILELVS